MKQILSGVAVLLFVASNSGLAASQEEIGCRHVYAKALTRFNDLGRSWLVDSAAPAYVPKVFAELLTANNQVFSTLGGVAAHAPGKAADVPALNEMLRDVDRNHAAVKEQLDQLQMNEYLFISGLNDIMARLNELASDLDKFHSPDVCGAYAGPLDDFRPSVKNWMAQLSRMAAFTQVLTTKRHKLVQAVTEGKRLQLKQEFASRQKIELDALEASLSEVFVALDFQAEFEAWNARTSRPVQALMYDVRQYHEAKLALIGHIRDAETFRGRALAFKGLSEENRVTLLRPIDTRLAVLKGQLAETEQEGWKGYQLRQKQFLDNVLARRSTFSDACVKQAEVYLVEHPKAVSTLDRRELDVLFMAAKMECSKGATP